MTTIYIVTQGEYSDYRIRAVFSTRENAEKYVAGMRGDRQYDDHDIEEYELDEWTNPVLVPHYHADITFDTGQLRVYPIVPVRWAPHALWSEVIIDTISSKSSALYGQTICNAMSVISAEHVTKLCIEARQKWLQEKAS